MAIVINGSGTVTGISVGGLPDGIVDAGTLATNSVDSAELIDGSVDNSHIDAMAASKLTGALPAISGASLTGLSSGLYESIAIICDQKAYNVHGGTFTTGAWRTRDLNTEISDADGIVSISSNQFTLAAGTYTMWWSCPAYQVNKNTSRLYNITDSSVVQYSVGLHPYTGDYTTTRGTGHSVFTIAGSKAFEIQHRCASTKTDEGFGNQMYIDSGGVSIYTVVEILKHS